MSVLGFIVMGIYLFLTLVFSIYTFHACLMLYLHKKYKSNAKLSTKTFQEQNSPFVTIQLPIYNEKYVVERLIYTCAELDYPKDKMEIQVLDDSTDETQQIAAELCKKLQAKGINIHYIHRKERKGFKAGALRNGLATAKGDFIAIFDADFVPPKDFLKKMLPHFSAPNIGLVQARWGHINDNYSFFTLSQSLGLDAHFVLEQGPRNSASCFITFNGTGGIWRKETILDAGNWADDTLTEDMDLSYRAQLKGWRFVYVNEVVCPAELPAEIFGFKNQQYRWAKGAIQTAKKILPVLWKRKNISLLAKFEGTIHLTNHLVFPALLFASLLLLPMLFVKSHHREASLFFAIISIFTLNIFIYPIFYIYAQKQIHPHDWKKRIFAVPLVIIGAIGLSVVNSRAVFSALFGRTGEFKRTPKYNISKPTKDVWYNKSYFSKADTNCFIELTVACYLAVTLFYSLNKDELLAIPFVLLYFLAFFYISLLSITHTLRKG